MPLLIIFSTIKIKDIYDLLWLKLIVGTVKYVVYVQLNKISDENIGHTSRHSKNTNSHLIARLKHNHLINLSKNTNIVGACCWILFISLGGSIILFGLCHIKEAYLMAFMLPATYNHSCENHMKPNSTQKMNYIFLA